MKLRYVLYYVASLLMLAGMIFGTTVLTVFNGADGRILTFPFQPSYGMTDPIRFWAFWVVILGLTTVYSLLFGRIYRDRTQTNYNANFDRFREFIIAIQIAATVYMIASMRPLSPAAGISNATNFWTSWAVLALNVNVVGLNIGLRGAVKQHAPTPPTMIEVEEDGSW